MHGFSLPAPHPFAPGTAARAAVLAALLSLASTPLAPLLHAQEPAGGAVTGSVSPAGTTATAEAPADRAAPRPPATGPDFAVPFQTFAGSELDTYLRTLQNLGRAAPYPWSIRGFSPGDVERLGIADSGHPWGARGSYRPPGTGAAGPDPGSRRGPEWGLVQPRVGTIYNSAFPFGGNDGPLWAGRGLTTSVEAGAWARWGPLSLVVAPTWFRAENRDFELAPNGMSGEDNVYRSPLTPRNADIPQAFGEGAYARLDPGNSTLRLDLYGAAVGISSAAQQWGPSQVHPLVLGPNAGGFSHAFAGTERPVSVGLGRIHGRVVWGRLEGSDFAPSRMRPSGPLHPRRLMTGLVAVFEPRGLTGLELGITRFAHIEWPTDLGWEHLRQPFKTVIGSRPEAHELEHPNNELASAFFRWNAPSAGFEIFGEWVRVDGAGNTRVFVIEPDDLSGYALGARKVWEAPDHLTALRGEVFSTVSSHRLRAGARLQYAERGRPMYQHSQLVQGHTHRGQLLASPAGHGGQGSTVAVDRYHADGRWTVEFERRLERDRTVGIVGEDPADTDVTYALGVEMLRFRGPVDVHLGVRGVYNLNRYLQDDRFNLNLRLGVAAAL